MSLCIILLKLKLWILCQDLIHYRDNNPTIRAFIYRLLVLLLKEASMPAILSTYRSLKHPSNLPLVAVLYTILTIDFFLPNFAYYLNPCIYPRLCPRLITLEDLIALLISLINVFLCLFKPLLSILLRNGRFLPWNALCIPFFLKCCPYCFLTIVKAKDPRDLYPRRFTILLRSCGPLD